MRQLKIAKAITNRDSPALERYLQEIGKVSLLTMEEEVELARRIKQGDHDALEKLTNANLRFVVSVAKQYQHQGLPLNDLINEGNLGLIKAAQRFDETRGFKFISYAVWWIRQSILQALAEQSRIVRLPLNKVGSLHKINRAFARLEQEFEREPTAEELSESLEIDKEEIEKTLRVAAKHISIDAPLQEGGDSGNLGDLLPSGEGSNADQNMVFHESLSMEVARSIATLEPRQQEVMKMYFGVCGSPPASLEEIARHLDLTRERVRQIKDKAIVKLRTATRNKILKHFLG